MKNGKKFEKADDYLPTLLEAMHERVWDWNIELNAVKFSDAWCQALGYDPDEVAPDFSFYERLILPEDLPEVKNSSASTWKDRPRFLKVRIESS